jgi:hypothetical protein
VALISVKGLRRRGPSRPEAAEALERDRGWLDSKRRGSSAASISVKGLRKRGPEDAGALTLERGGGWLDSQPAPDSESQRRGTSGGRKHESWRLEAPGSLERCGGWLGSKRRGTSAALISVESRTRALPWWLEAAQSADERGAALLGDALCLCAELSRSSRSSKLRTPWIGCEDDDEVLEVPPGGKNGGRCAGMDDGADSLASSRPRHRPLVSVESRARVLWRLDAARSFMVPCSV